ncbi:hypothetical protein Psi02_54820 [Planotetraspora silvatica]|uniref:Uncharacterized protein n=1 Tax=Planotetraspora silvatica TaxID=234614 RepID=A0A8J3UPN7_9ACTN|nr:hypothetical protein Psi02_54820 [Planotetraspora silvatica]
MDLETGGVEQGDGTTAVAQLGPAVDREAYGASGTEGPGKEEECACPDRRDPIR